MDYAIAVIDIGMTNKKVAVYDEALRQLDAQYRVFEPLITDGLPCHDLDAMETWFLDKLASAGKKFPIKAITVSTHGANFVCTGKDGKAAVPCIFYTHEPGKTRIDVSRLPRGIYILHIALPDSNIQVRKLIKN